MTVKELKEKLSLKYLCGEEIAENKKITGCYCGDLLSWVMAKANSGDAWPTVMGNKIAVGVAVLTDMPCIILTENAPLDDDAKEKAIEENIVILSTGKNTYETAVGISKLL